MHRDILPDRPLKLSTRYRANRLTVLALLGVLPAFTAVATIQSLAIELPALNHEQATWDRGKPCLAGSFENSYAEDQQTEANIRCRQDDGVVHEGTFTLYGVSSWELYPYEDDAEVRYDPSDRDELVHGAGIALIDVRRDRIRSEAIAMLTITALLGGIAGLFGRKLWIARQLARRGNEGEVHVVRVKTIYRRKHETHARRVYWKIEASRRRTHRAYMDSKQGLAWLNSNEPRALALVSPNGRHALLLTGTLEPLQLDDAERARVMARLASEGGGLPRGLSELADWIVLSPPPPAMAPATPPASGDA